jgi:hypothetical protein
MVAYPPHHPTQALDVDLCDVLEFRALHEGLKKMTHFKPQVWPLPSPLLSVVFVEFPSSSAAAPPNSLSPSK